MLLIQVGGLGTMTLAAMAILLAGRRLSLRSQALVSDTFFQQDVGAEFRVSFSHILILTFAVETIGAVFLFFAFLQYMDPSSAAFSAVFHAVSAFCNAGFSDHSLNIVQFRDSVTIITVISSLIVLGGLGYMVLHEVWRVFVGAVRNMQLRRKARLSLHTRVVLVITPLLLFWGAAGLLLCGMTSDETGVSDGILHAFFQSVSARTAGFNSVDIGKLPAASLFVLIMLMFVGGSPASCAGGIKTTSLGLWVARLYASVHGRKEVRLLDRSVPEDLLNRAELLLGLAILWNLVGILIMLTTQSHLQAPAIDLIFEQISAFGTVGLSTGVTAKLSVTGKLWISLTMFVGRTGPLTVALWMFQRDNAHIGYPKGTVMIG
jgi:trk system potassium uptake protein TrkH